MTQLVHPLPEEEGSTDAESDPGDPTVAWCPPIPDATEDPIEVEIASAADQLAILISKTQQRDNPFCNPDNLGALPPLWLQARLQLTLPAIQEKFSRILVSAASPSGGCGPPRGMAVRGGGGPVRVRGDVKAFYSAGELLKAPVPNES